eukprot:c24457_g1_i1 orf=217-1446(-)
MLIEEIEDLAASCKPNLKQGTDSLSKGNTDLHPKKLIEDVRADGCEPSSNCATNLYPNTLILEGGRNTECGPVNSQRLAVKLFVGAGARLLFYPTLFYNVVRNKFEADFRWWDQIEPFLLLGAVPFPKDVYRLKSLGVEAVITLNESYETLVSPSLYESQMIKHLVIPTRDYLFAPTFDDIERAVDFIHENVEQGKATYVHCKAGRGRSTTIVLCYLVKYRGMTPFNAFNYVRSKRPRVLLAASQWKAVLRYSEYQHFEREANFTPFFPLPHQWPMYKILRVGGDSNTAMLGLHDTSCCGELPVLVTLSDLDGYEEKNEDSCSGNELQGELGLAYKVGILTAKSVIGVAKASATLARLSYIWLGYQAENQAFNMTLACSTLSDAGGQSAAVTRQPMVSLHVCQQGLVKC